MSTLLGENLDVQAKVLRRILESLTNFNPEVGGLCLDCVN